MTNVNLDTDSLSNYVIGQVNLWKSFGYNLKSVNNLIEILTKVRNEQLVDKLNTLSTQLEGKKDA